MKTFTTAEIAAQLGVQEKEVIQLGIKEGIMNEIGEPTQKGYDLGLFVNPEDPILKFSHTVVMSKFDDESYYFSDIGFIADKKEFVLESIELLKKGDYINLVRSVECFENLKDFENYLTDNQ